MIRIDIIAGARPNFMKIAPILRAFEKRRGTGPDIGTRLIHTGQHYDETMSGSFFAQLGIRPPDHNLEVGSGTQAEQAAGMMVGYENLLMKERSDLCLVVGDVTSTMACAISAQKLHVPVGHVEGGIRSHDWSMPEEINRLVTDAITNWVFTTSRVANELLGRSGVGAERIFFVGNTMIDSLLFHKAQFSAPQFYREIGLESGNYLLATLHRPTNVDEPEKFGRYLQAISSGSRSIPVILPLHPRSAKTAKKLPSIPANIHFVEPQPYFEFGYLLSNAKAVITDSGGVTEEATALGIPCMTLRDSTERPETVTIGTNELLGTDPDAIIPALGKLFDDQWKRGSIPELWDGKAAERIVKAVEEILCN